MKKELVLFDLDGTLFNGNSTYDFIKYVNRDNKEYLKFIQQYKYMRFYNKICFTLFGYDWYKKKSVRFLKNYTKEEIEDLADHFYLEVLSKNRIEYMIDLMEYHRQKGYKIAIITATLDVIASKVSKILKVDYIYSTPIIFDSQNIATGCYGKDLLHGKSDIFHTKIKNSFDKILFFSDNKQDIQLLKEVTLGFKIYGTN